MRPPPPQHAWRPIGLLLVSHVRALLAANGATEADIDAVCGMCSVALHRCALTRKGANDNRPGVPGVRRCPPPSASEPHSNTLAYNQAAARVQNFSCCTGSLPA